MNTLDYAIPKSTSWSWRQWTALLLPIAATGFLFFIAASNAVEEPYGFFNWSDALLQVGGLGCVILMWLAWLGVWAVLVRRTSRLWLMLPVAFWALLNIWGAYTLGVSYFYEPWNWH